VGDTRADIVGRGWPFPVRPAVQEAGRDGSARLTGLAFQGGPEKVRQAIWLVLATSPGERQMLPEFGCGIHDLVFQPNTSGVRGLVQVRVREALARWEPRIDVLDIRVGVPPDTPNELHIAIDYRLRGNNAVFNLVYPFYLAEGVE
jgi:phage baseplate assembly protein W